MEGWRSGEAVLKVCLTAVSAHPGTGAAGKFSGSAQDEQNQELRVVPGACVLINPPGDSATHLKVRSTGSEDSGDRETS